MHERLKDLLIPVPKEVSLSEDRYLVLTGDTVRQIHQFTLSQDLPAQLHWRRMSVGKDVDRGFTRYCIEITSEAVFITCSERETLYSAVQTLRQLLEGYHCREGNSCVPLGTISDSSRYEWRAFLLDISRDRVPELQTIYGYIDLISHLKYNQLQLYMEHTYAYRGHETVWKDAGALSEDDFSAVERYCADRGVHLVANQNCFGHMERWLKHPEYAHLAETPEGFTDMWGVFRPLGFHTLSGGGRFCLSGGGSALSAAEEPDQSLREHRGR